MSTGDDFGGVGQNSMDFASLTPRFSWGGMAPFGLDGERNGGEGMEAPSDKDVEQPTMGY